MRFYIEYLVCHIYLIYSEMYIYFIYWRFFGNYLFVNYVVNYYICLYTANYLLKTWKILGVWQTLEAPSPIEIIISPRFSCCFQSYRIVAHMMVIMEVEIAMVFDLVTE